MKLSMSGLVAEMLNIGNPGRNIHAVCGPVRDLNISHFTQLRPGLPTLLMINSRTGIAFPCL